MPIGGVPIGGVPVGMPKIKELMGGLNGSLSVHPFGFSRIQSAVFPVLAPAERVQAAPTEYGGCSCSDWNKGEVKANRGREDVVDNQKGKVGRNVGCGLPMQTTCGRNICFISHSSFCLCTAGSIVDTIETRRKT